MTQEELDLFAEQRRKEWLTATADPTYQKYCEQRRQEQLLLPTNKQRKVDTTETPKPCVCRCEPSPPKTISYGYVDHPVAEANRAYARDRQYVRELMGV